jgi:hypothetical protein
MEVNMIKTQKVDNKTISNLKPFLNEWVMDELGMYFKVLDINEETNIITIDTWDTLQFTPVHAMAYSMMSNATNKLKEQFK